MQILYEVTHNISLKEIEEAEDGLYIKDNEYRNVFSINPLPFDNIINDSNGEISYSETYNDFNYSYIFEITIDRRMKIIELLSKGHTDNNDSKKIYLKYKIVLTNNDNIIDEYLNDCDIINEYTNDGIVKINSNKNKWDVISSYSYEHISKENLDNLIIKIKIIVFYDNKVNEVCYNEIIPDIIKNRFIDLIKTEDNNYGRFINRFNYKKYNDLEIRFINNKNIYVSKLILCTESKYFDSMFSSNMQESKKNIIDLKDINYDSAYNVLKYMYCKNIEHVILESNKNDDYIYKLIEMYTISDMWIMEDLQKNIISKLIERITVTNIDILLKFANDYELGYLKTILQKFKTYNKISIY